MASVSVAEPLVWRAIWRPPYLPGEEPPDPSRASCPQDAQPWMPGSSVRWRLKVEEAEPFGI